MQCIPGPITLKLKVGDFIKIEKVTNEKYFSFLKVNDVVEVLEVLYFDHQAKRFLFKIKTSNESHLDWPCQAEDFSLVVKDDHFSPGDYVVILSGGYNTNPQVYPEGDVNKVCRIVEISDNVKKRNVFRFSLEIDSPNNVSHADYFINHKIIPDKQLRHATSVEIRKFYKGPMYRSRMDDEAIETKDKTVPVGSIVSMKPKHEFSHQSSGAVFGIVSRAFDHRGWCRVDWVNETGKIISENGYTLDHIKVLQIPQEQFTINKTETPMAPKLQESEDRNLAQMKVEVVLPEELLKERVDKVVMYRLREEQLQGIVSNVLLRHREGIKSELQKSVLEKLEEKFVYNKEDIIKSFLESKRTEIFLDKKPVALIDDPMAHKELPTLIKFLTLFKQAMIVGPTGSGKSTLAKQAADAMKLRYASFSCNMEASKSELVGFANLNGYVTSQFLDFYENGGLFLIDEYDAMSPSIAVVLNAVFDRSGQISVPNREGNTVAKKHENFYCILAGNTWGSGSVEYQGREMQDMAFLDRFKMCRIFIDYDTNIEKQIAGVNYEWLRKIRNFVDKNLDSEKFSTRSIHDATLLLANGVTKSQLIDMVTSHWDPELKKKLLADVPL